MKCVCGYEYYKDYCNNGEDDKGDQKFIMLEKIHPIIDSIDNYGRTYEHGVTIYACPKCGTLRLNL